MLKKVIKQIRSYRDKKYFSKLSSDLKMVVKDGSVTMLDVGASGGILPRWEGLKKIVSFIGIEPDERSYRELMNSKVKDEFYSYDIICKGAWSSKTTVKILFTNKPMCSTHFAPDHKILSKFPEADRFEIASSFEIDCNTLDNLFAEKLDQIDFIKLDLEGGEAEVLNGSSKLLCSCLGLHIEVGFQPIRIGQPLFGDINLLMKNNGFEFIDFITIARWERDIYTNMGQSIFGDALFLRSPEALIRLILDKPELKDKKIKSYLSILLIYERYDLALKLISLIVKFNIDCNQAYLEKILLIVKKRRKKQQMIYNFMTTMNSVAAVFGGPNTSFHYIY